MTCVDIRNNLIHMQCICYYLGILETSYTQRIIKPNLFNHLTWNLLYILLLFLILFIFFYVVFAPIITTTYQVPTLISTLLKLSILLLLLNSYGTSTKPRSKIGESGRTQLWKTSSMAPIIAKRPFWSSLVFMVFTFSASSGRAP